ncbi:MAG: hypothetical protein K0S26_3415, partial [Bacteroidota bacterium]|nr:hypothetical protein [Bacteroidota bacterium]
TWDCELKTLFRDSNLGCGLAVSGAINWFFDHVEEGIILEDDCLPDPSFFDFCARMLERYRDNDSIKTISGNNFQNGIKRGDGSYYFSNFADIWGWACWKRTWLQYDFKLKAWPAFRDKKLNKLLHNDRQQIDFWTNTLNSVHAGKIDTWDYQMLFTVWNNNGIAIHPNVNLISNIGFNSEATHTTNISDKLNNQPRSSYIEDVIPSKIKVNTKADDYNFYQVHTERASYKEQFKSFTKQTLKTLFPPVIISVLKKLKKPVIHEEHGWFGNYNTWEEAESQCSGYDNNVILQKVKSAILKVKSGEAKYERDSVLFNEIEYSPGLLNAFELSIENNQLHVTDFGGSLGSTYFQNRSLFPDTLNLKWSVVEQKHFVECGQKEIAEKHLSFYHTIGEALQHQKNQVLLLSSVLPYFKEPYELISTLLKYRFKYIIIDRTAFIEGETERITKQVVPSFIYKASYPAWFFNEKKFIAAFNKDYDLINSFDSGFDPKEPLEDQVISYRKGFYLKLKE